MAGKTVSARLTTFLHATWNDPKVEGRNSVAHIRPKERFAPLHQMERAGFDPRRTGVMEAAGLTELSMRMSGDFEEAILEGSTLVRVGSSLWKGVDEEPPAGP